MNAQRFCQYCGSSMEPDWQFCERCGGQPAVETPAPEAPTVFHPPVRIPPTPASDGKSTTSSEPAGPPVQSTPAAPKSESKRRLIWLIPVGVGCLGFVCICLIVVVGYFVLRRPVASPIPSTPTLLSEFPIAATNTPAPSPTDLPTATGGVEPTELATSTEALPTQTEPVPTEESEGLTGNQYRDEVSIFDDFSSKALEWPEYDDGITILQYEGEAYSFQITEADYFDWAYAPVDFWPNAIQFDVWGLPGVQEGTFGVFCQFQDIENYYFVEIDLETRTFLMGQYLADEFMPLTIPDENGQYWLSADPLKTYPDEVNRIDLTCYQDFLVLAINDALVYHATVPDPFPNPGEMAFFVYSFSFAGPEGYQVFFDNVAVQQVEE